MCWGLESIGSICDMCRARALPLCHRCVADDLCVWQMRLECENKYVYEDMESDKGLGVHVY